MDINKPVSTFMLFTISLVLALFFIIPQYQESRALQLQLLQAQADYNGVSTYFIKIADIVKSIKDRLEVLAKVDSALPSEPSFSPIVYFLQQKASASTLQLKSIVFSEISDDLQASSQTMLETPKGQLEDITFVVTVFGSYQGLKGFLLALEKSARLFEVDSVSLVPAGSRNQVSLYDAVLEIKTHSY